jgi:hypothetical protein
MAIIYPEGTQRKFINYSRFEYTAITQLSNASAETNFWSVNYNRQSGSSHLYIHSLFPTAELPNGVWLGSFMTVNGYKHAKGLISTRTSDAGVFGFTCMVAPSEIGSTTGNITISHGWYWNRYNDAGRPINWINFEGGSGSAANLNRDPRITSGTRTTGELIVQEFA